MLRFTYLSLREVHFPENRLDVSIAFEFQKGLMGSNEITDGHLSQATGASHYLVKSLFEFIHTLTNRFYNLDTGSIRHLHALSKNTWCDL